MGSSVISPSPGSVTGAYVNRGNIDGSTNPNYPAAINGDTYIITVAGKVGGASGKTVEVGDMVIAKADNAGGTEGSVGASWVVVQGNVAFTAAGLALATAADAAAQRTALGLGTIATQAANAVAITGGTITGLSSLKVETGTSYLYNPTVGSNQLVLGATTNGTTGVAFLVSGTSLTCMRPDQGAHASLTVSNITITGGSINLSQSNDLFLVRDAAAIAAVKNSTTAQTLRVYGTTTGSKYLNLTHDGTNSVITSSAGQIGLASAALATTATAGYVCLTSCAGIPTGVPASIPTGTIPFTFDSTNSKLYAYLGGAWKSVTLA
jgi:hypothetical protein